MGAAMKAIPITSPEQWHDLRRQHVGGSDIASIFNAWRSPDGEVQYKHLFAAPPKGAELLGCVSPYKTGVRLWHERAGNLQEEPFDNARTEAGQFLEPGIAAWAAHRTGWTVRKVEDYLKHDSIEMLGASLDYEVPDHPKGHAALDCKDVRWSIWKEAWAGNDNGEAEPPLHIILQLHHQMAVTGWPHSCAAVNEAGVDLHIVEQPRIPAIISMIEEAVDAFGWTLRNAQEPDPMLDVAIAQDLYLTASPCLELDMTDSAEFLRLVETFETSRDMAAGWKAGREAAFNEILLRIRDAERVRLADGRILCAPTRKRRAFTSHVAEAEYRTLTIKERN